MVRRRLGYLGTKINQRLQPVFTSKKIADHLKVTEEKPPLINQQSVVHEFTCDLCDRNYIGYTCPHLHQRVEEHKHSLIGKHFRDVHDLTPDNSIKNFKAVVNLNAWSTKCCGLRTKDRNWTRKRTLFARNSLPERMLPCFHADLFFLTFKSINSLSVISNWFIWQWWHEVVEMSRCSSIVNFLLKHINVHVQWKYLYIRVIEMSANESRDCLLWRLQNAVHNLGCPVAWKVTFLTCLRRTSTSASFLMMSYAIWAKTITDLVVFAEVWASLRIIKRISTDNLVVYSLLTAQP